MSEVLSSPAVPLARQVSGGVDELSIREEIPDNWKPTKVQSKVTTGLKVPESVVSQHKINLEALSNLIPDKKTKPSLPADGSDLESFLHKSLLATFEIHQEAVQQKIKHINEVLEHEKQRSQKKKEKIAKLKNELSEIQKTLGEKSTQYGEMSKKIQEIEKKMSSREIQMGLVFHKLKKASTDMAEKDSKLAELAKKTSDEMPPEEALRLANEKLLLLEEKSKIADIAIAALIKQSEENVGKETVKVQLRGPIADAALSPNARISRTISGNIANQLRQLQTKVAKTEEEIEKVIKETRLNRIRDVIFGAGTRISREQMENFINALKLNTTINSIELSGVEIAEELVLMLAVAAVGKQNIQALTIDACSISPKIANEILKVISQTSIKKLSFDNNLLNNAANEWAVSLSKFLADNKTVSSLSVAVNCLGNQGLKEMITGLSSNKTLTSLDLSGNNLGKEGISALSSYLSKNTNIKAISLWGNMISIEGAKHLAEGLKNNTSITSLNLRGNNLREDGAKHIAALMETNKTIASLDLSGNLLGHEGLKTLVKAFKTSSSLTTLYLGGNNIGDEGANLVSQFISNQQIQFVNLELNLISNTGITKLAPALKESPSLIGLDLTWNRIGIEGAKLLKTSLGKNLKQVPFTGNALTEINDIAECKLSDLEITTEVPVETAKASSSNPRETSRIKKTISMHHLLSPQKQ